MPRPIVRGCGALAAVALLLLVVLAVRAASVRPAAEPGAAESLPSLPIDDAAAVARLQQALRFRTVTYDDPAQHDTAAFAALRDFLARSFPRVHALPHELVGGGTLLFTWQGRDPRLAPVLLMAHQDVVPIEDEHRWTHPPFAGELVGGYVWGRGAIDDKQAVMGLLEACEALLRDGFVPARTVLIELGHDEEGTGLEGARQVADLLRARGIHLALVLDEGGFYTDGLMPGLSAPAALVGVAEKGYVSLELIAHGEPGHSSRPPRGMAIARLARALTRLDDNPFPPRLTAPTRRMLEAMAPRSSFARRLALANLWLLDGVVAHGMAGETGTAPLVRTTTALTEVQGGTKDNVLPGEARAVVNLRLLPGDTVDGSLARVRRIADDPGIVVRPLAGGRIPGRAPGPRAFAPPRVARVDSPGWRVVTTAVRQSWSGDLVVAPFLLTGASDSRWFAPLADDVYRFTGFTLRPGDEERFHGIDERIAVADYARSIQVYGRVLRGLDGLR